jgi:hypothetical protein
LESADERTKATYVSPSPTQKGAKHMRVKTTVDLEKVIRYAEYRRLLATTDKQRVDGSRQSSDFCCNVFVALFVAMHKINPRALPRLVSLAAITVIVSPADETQAIIFHTRIA